MLTDGLIMVNRDLPAWFPDDYHCHPGLLTAFENTESWRPSGVKNKDEDEDRNDGDS